ncbi:MAG: PfkB family carbohydrate kinase, partial [Planctomycetota bacterium]
VILEKVSPYVDIFVPSLEELTYMMDRDLFDKRNAQAENNEPVLAYEPDDCTRASEKLLSMGMKIIAIKCGIRGLYLRTADEEKITSMSAACVGDVKIWAGREMWAPSYKTENFASALGSGDATIAGFLCGLIRSFSPEDSLKIANTVGWQNVQTLDTLSGIRDWSTTLEMLEDKERPRNPAGLDSQQWRYSKDKQLYYGPKDKHL